MPFAVFDPTTSITIYRVCRYFDYRGAGRASACKNLIDVAHPHVQTLRGLSELPGISISRARAADQNRSIASDRKFSMEWLPIGTACAARFRPTECPCQPANSRTDIGVVKIRRDRRKCIGHRIYLPQQSSERGAGRAQGIVRIGRALSRRCACDLDGPCGAPSRRLEYNPRIYENHG